ncbi:hypothetical protein KP509_19G014300 [Ceratopteris richardii]|uniref:Uncharacterized protein n=1 Tax=Ceratopteris richardii TaxID=49495 RepID=A0A8T2SHZ6_CERRI|nr:hypothetical protein KP509_19G014300 [Ceratopteris richardii]
MQPLVHMALMYIVLRKFIGGNKDLLAIVTPGGMPHYSTQWERGRWQTVEKKTSPGGLFSIVCAALLCGDRGYNRGFCWGVQRLMCDDQLYQGENTQRTTRGGCGFWGFSLHLGFWASAHVANEGSKGCSVSMEGRYSASSIR